MSPNTPISDYGLCTQPDFFIEDKPIWYVDLSNGIKVYQDDNREGQEEACAWKRLFDYCSEQQISIVSMALRFRSHIIHLPNQSDVEGYYFSYGVVKEITDTETQNHYICGMVKDGQLSCEWYSTPEFLVTKTSTRTITSNDVEEKRLILT